MKAAAILSTFQPQVSPSLSVLLHPKLVHRNYSNLRLTKPPVPFLTEKNTQISNKAIADVSQTVN
jgi:hypothetical protein